MWAVNETGFIQSFAIGPQCGEMVTAAGLRVHHHHQVHRGHRQQQKQRQQHRSAVYPWLVNFHDDSFIMSIIILSRRICRVWACMPIGVNSISDRLLRHGLTVTIVTSAQKVLRLATGSNCSEFKEHKSLLIRTAKPCSEWFVYEQHTK